MTSSQQHEEYMRRAIELSREGVAAGQTPFGAVIARDGNILAATHNCVWDGCDPTAHAEVRAIREAAKALGSIDLKGCAIYSSCEPCPMCFSAIHWSGLSELYCGARIEDAEAAGFREMPIPIEEMKRQGNCGMRIVRDLLRDEAAAILQDFARNHAERLY